MSRVLVALIRHGDYQQLANTPSAHQAYPLTNKGHAQAHTLAQMITQFCKENSCQLNPIIASSRLLRAWQTANNLRTSLTNHNIQIQEFNELAERCVGSVANLTVTEISKLISQDPRYQNLPSDWKSDSKFCLPFQGAESLLDSGQRVASLLQTEIQSIAKQSQSEQLKIFIGHGAAFRHAAYHLGILEYEQIARLSMFHCQPVYLEFSSDHKWRHIAGDWKIRNAHSQYKD